MLNIVVVSLGYDVVVMMMMVVVVVLAVDSDVELF